MKSLIFALLIALSTTAKADIFVMPNKDGGQIVLTTRTCSKEPSLLSGYAYGKGGLTLPFCWAYFDNMVHVVYDDGTRYIYNPELFTRRGVSKGTGV